MTTPTYADQTAYIEKRIGDVLLPNNVNFWRRII